MKTASYQLLFVSAVLQAAALPGKNSFTGENHIGSSSSYGTSEVHLDIAPFQAAIDAQEEVLQGAQALAALPVTNLAERKNLSANDEEVLGQYIEKVSAAQHHVTKLQNHGIDFHSRRNYCIQNNMAVEARKCSLLQDCATRAAKLIEEPCDEKLAYLSALKLTIPSTKHQVLSDLQTKKALLNTLYEERVKKIVSDDWRRVQ